MAKGGTSIKEYLQRHPVLATAASTVMSQIGRPLISLITLPLLIAYLGQARLGLWMIALSLMTIIGFASAGLSTGIVTMIGRASGSLDTGMLRRMVSAATVIAALWGIVVVVLGVPAALWVDWTRILKLNTAAEGEDFAMLMSALIIVLGFAFVASVPRQIMVGRMHGYLANAVEFVGLIAGVGALAIAIWLKAPLWVLGAAFMAPTSLVSLLVGTAYLLKSGIGLPSAALIDRETFSDLARDSARMAGYQGAFAVSSQSDLILIGMFLGTPASVAYGIAQRIFALPVLISSAFNYAQWPAMARADAAGEHARVAQMLRHTVLMGCSTAISTAILAAVFYQDLLLLWLGHSIETGLPIILGMVVWVGVSTYVNCCSAVLKAQNDSSFLMNSMITMAAINLGATVLLLPRIGPSGAIWGSTIGFVAALAIPYSLRIRNTLWQRM